MIITKINGLHEYNTDAPNTQTTTNCKQMKNMNKVD